MIEFIRIVILLSIFLFGYIYCLELKDKYENKYYKGLIWLCILLWTAFCWYIVSQFLGLTPMSFEDRTRQILGK